MLLIDARRRPDCSVQDGEHRDLMLTAIAAEGEVLAAERGLAAQLASPLMPAA